MRIFHGQLRYSATDLVHHLTCKHLTELERQVAEGQLVREFYHDPVVELLRELGDRHEAAYLDSLRKGGKTVIELHEFGGQQCLERTHDAMRAGIDVIAQASLQVEPWHGRADFLIKVDRPSDLGLWSYEVADTKLAKNTHGGTALQLCLYSELVAILQGAAPRTMYVVRPGNPFQVDALRVADFAAYYRMLKHQFEGDLAQPPNPDSYPEPNSHCQVCGWWQSCHDTWRRDDHLTYVAGMGKAQIAELEPHSITTLAQFAQAPMALPSPPQRGSLQTFVKLQRQAKIQWKGRETDSPRYEFHDLEASKGFYRLPLPSDADIFFDIEGYPRAIGESLEYLLGYVTCDSEEPQYHQLWALNPREEKTAFEAFMDFVMDRWKKFPDMHIYHFAPYEPSALKRLATRHATRELELDQLLRGNRLVDLYAIVRQGVLASVESYSIKELERFYKFARRQELREASTQLRLMERLIELELTKDISEDCRRIIQRYNEEDCLSTLRLRDWLEQLRHELEDKHKPIPRPEPGERDASEEAQQRAAEVQEVFDQLVADIDDEPQTEDQHARWLLAHMLEYFRREDKCVWWEFFRLHELEHDELLRERKAISGLQFVRAVPGDGRLPTHRYQFPLQEVTMEPKSSLVVVGGERIGSVAEVDHLRGFIDIKKRGDSVDVHPNAVFAFDHIRSEPMPESLLEFGRQLISSSSRSARYDLLARRAPRLRIKSLPLAGDQTQAAIELAFDLDHSYLPIQGPPGAGKTYVGSHMIAALAHAGKRVGVTAVSHKVIINLLDAVQRNVQEGERILVAHKGKPEDDLPDGIQLLSSNDEALSAVTQGKVVGGTAWLWSRADAADKLDYLFIDEAGQMSLAMAIAAGRAAKNIVLLGDPQQLEQPQQGTHPENAGRAALDHVLHGAETMPEDRGLFLEQTWRLHPAICEFTSEQYYDGRLHSRDGLHRQELSGTSHFVGHGLRFVPVPHEHNDNRSDEEVAVIASIVGELNDGHHRWVNLKGKTIDLTLDDILIVAPYNAQVSALRNALPNGARVGTVDKFQGQEAPVVIYSMTSSSVVDAPRGMGFLFSRNRMNVATSRARCLAILVGSPELFQPYCETPEQMRLANGFCRFMEMAETIELDLDGD